MAPSPTVPRRFAVAAHPKIAEAAGLAAEIAEFLTARGARFTQNDPSRRHAVWLLTEGIVDLETMRELEPQVTAGGDVFRAQVVGYFDDSGPCARADVVVDATTSPPKQVYWKDLRLFGRGYSLETLGAERPAD